MRQPIRIAQITTTSELFRPEGYSTRYRPRGWFASQACSVAWWVLRKSRGLRAYEHLIETHTYTPAQQDQVDKMILHHVDYLWRRGENPDDFAICIGGKDFHDLTGIMMHSARLMLSGEFRYRTNDRAEFRDYRPPDAEFRGLPIILVPYMEGTALIPKRHLEAHKSGVSAARRSYSPKSEGDENA